jgi:hypothetical protein
LPAWNAASIDGAQGAKFLLVRVLVIVIVIEFRPPAALHSAKAVLRQVPSASSVKIILGRTFSGLHGLFDYDYAHEHAHEKYRSGNRTACFGPNAERR